MAEAIELKAWARARSGKGGARSTRREGRIPGILYGDKKEPETIAVDYRAISQQHLHNVEAHFYRRILQQAQVIEPRPRQPPAALLVHRGSRARPFLRGARLDLHEYQAIPVPEDQVNLAARRTEVGDEELQALALEVFPGLALTHLAVAQVERLLALAPPRLDTCRQSHAIP